MTYTNYRIGCRILNHFSHQTIGGEGSREMSRDIDISSLADLLQHEGWGQGVWWWISLTEVQLQLLGYQPSGAKF